jgi:hypothetical protein
VKQNGAFPKGNAAAPYVTQDPATGWLTLTGERPGNTGYTSEVNFPYHYTGIYTWNLESINYPYALGSLQCRMRYILPNGDGSSPAYNYTWEPNNNGKFRITGTGATNQYPAAYSTWATSGKIRSAQVRISGTTDTVLEYYINGEMVYTYTRTGQNPNDYRMNMDFMVSTDSQSLDYEIILKSMTWAPLE